MSGMTTQSSDIDVVAGPVVFLCVLCLVVEPSGTRTWCPLGSSVFFHAVSRMLDRRAEFLEVLRVRQDTFLLDTPRFWVQFLMGAV